MCDKPNGDPRAYHATSVPGIYRRGEPRRVPGRKGLVTTYVVRFTDSEGKRRQAKAYSMSEAKKLQARLRNEVANHTYVPPTDLTLKQYAEDWISHYKGTREVEVRAYTRDEYRRDLMRCVDFLAGTTGRRPLASIKSRDIENLVAHLFAVPLQRRTVTRIIGPLKSMFAQAVRDELLARNPAEGLRIVGCQQPVGSEPKAEDDTYNGKALTQEQMDALWKVVPRQHRTFVAFIAQTGLRIGEALGVKWGDIEEADFDDDGKPQRVWLHVRRSVREGKFIPPKSKSAYRKVPISDDLWRALRVHRMASPYKQPDDLVFPSRVGTPQRANNISTRWARDMFDAAGIPSGRAWHALRHTFATNAVHSGEHHVVVAKVIGHSRASFTMDRYVSVRDDDLPSGNRLAAAGGLAGAVPRVAFPA